MPLHSVGDIYGSKSDDTYVSATCKRCISVAIWPPPNDALKRERDFTYSDPSGRPLGPANPLAPFSLVDKGHLRVTF